MITKFVLVAMLMFPNGTYQLTYNSDFSFPNAQACQNYVNDNYDLVETGLKVWIDMEYGIGNNIEVQRIGCAPEEENPKGTGINA